LALEIPERARARLRAWAAEARPREACGLLIGRRRGGECRVSRAVLADNVAPADRASRYEVDPLAVVAADRRARVEGLALVGVWHSHPAGPALPSERDRREAWPGWLYAIVGADGRLRAWRLAADRADEVPVRVIRGDGTADPLTAGRGS